MKTPHSYMQENIHVRQVGISDSLIVAYLYLKLPGYGLLCLATLLMNLPYGSLHVYDADTMFSLNCYFE